MSLHKSKISDVAEEQDELDRDKDIPKPEVVNE